MTGTGRPHLEFRLHLSASKTCGQCIPSLLWPCFQGVWEVLFLPLPIWYQGSRRDKKRLREELAISQETFSHHINCVIRLIPQDLCFWAFVSLCLHNS